MIALMLAAQLVAAPPLLQTRVFRQAAPSAACKSNGKVEASTPAEPALAYRSDRKASVQPLAELPKPNKEKAVLRSVDGCANPLVVQFNVGP